MLFILLIFFFKPGTFINDNVIRTVVTRMDHGVYNE